MMTYLTGTELNALLKYREPSQVITCLLHTSPCMRTFTGPQAHRPGNHADVQSRGRVASYDICSEEHSMENE